MEKIGKKVCALDGCGRKHAALGLCKLHWNRQYRGQDLNAPVRRYRRSDGYVKECSKCGTTKPLEDYYFRYGKYPLPWCKVCQKAMTAEYKARKAAEKAGGAV